MKGETFFFEVNGFRTFLKGANLVPIHILPERVTKQKIEELLTFAKEAHMNVIRVWGGGMYESDYLYARADELGLLIWQDMMFGCR